MQIGMDVNYTPLDQQTLKEKYYAYSFETSLHKVFISHVIQSISLSLQDVLYLVFSELMCSYSSQSHQSTSHLKTFLYFIDHKQHQSLKRLFLRLSFTPSETQAMAMIAIAFCTP